MTIKSEERRGGSLIKAWNALKCAPKIVLQDQWKLWKREEDSFMGKIIRRWKFLPWVWILMNGSNFLFTLRHRLVKLSQGRPQLSKHGEDTYTIQFDGCKLLCPHHVIFSREEPNTWRGHFPMSPYVWAPLLS